MGIKIFLPMMKNFRYAKATSLMQASELANATVADISNGDPSAPQTTVLKNVLKAGGIDLLDLMKEGIANPDGLVALHRLEGSEYRAIRGGQLGFLVTLSQMADDAGLRENYTALQEASLHAATPQVRRMATLGGNLMQRPRCPYFRSEYHNCLKKGGDTCFALTGPSELHAIFNNMTCAFVQASSVSTALLAFDATVVTTDREIPLAEFFVTPDEDLSRENVIRAGEIITGVRLTSEPGTRVSAYQKTTPRDSYDWALVDVAISATPSGNGFSDYRVVMGAVGPKPMRATAVEDLLNGKTLTGKLISQAGELATKGATPLTGNAYKVPMLAATVRHVLEKLSA